MAQGYVWFLPGWFKEDWYDIDKLQEKEKLEEQNASSDTSRYKLFSVLRKKCLQF